MRHSNESTAPNIFHLGNLEFRVVHDAVSRRRMVVGPFGADPLINKKTLLELRRKAVQRARELELI